MYIKKEVVKRVGEKIKEERKNQELTKKEVVKKAGLNNDGRKVSSAISILSGIEGGYGTGKYFMIEEALKCGKALGITPYELFEKWEDMAVEEDYEKAFVPEGLSREKIKFVPEELSKEKIEKAMNQGIKLGKNIEKMNNILALRGIYFESKYSLWGLGRFKKKTKVIMDIINELFIENDE